MTEPAVSRRNALATCAAACMVVPLAAACGSDEAAAPSGNAGETATTPSGSSSNATSGRPTTPPIASTGDIPVGGGKIIADQNVVITQPTAGQFKAFDGTCTHAGNPVGSVSGGEIICPFHGSQFSIKDGTVDRGPARAPLAPVAIQVTDGEIYLS